MGGRPVAGLRACGLAAAAGILLGLPAGLAGAELYRCRRADGSLVYSDAASACPGSDPHQLSGEVQSTPTAVPPAAQARAGGGAALERRLEEAQAARWRQRREDAEQKLREAEERAAYLLGFVAHCNHGRRILSEDVDGVRTPIRCVEIRDELAALESQAAELRAYLEEGLAEECRREGCLPGWLR
jgi:hypothetical protein